jgi:hypothetical protein
MAVTFECNTTFYATLAGFDNTTCQNSSQYFTDDPVQFLSSYGMAT